MLTMMELRAYARAHEEKPDDGPGASLLWEVKAERKRLQDAGKLK